MEQGTPERRSATENQHPMEEMRKLRENSFNPLRAEETIRGYYEALESSNYEVAYTYLNPEFVPLDLSQWVALNSEAGYVAEELEYDPAQFYGFSPDLSPHTERGYEFYLGDYQKVAIRSAVSPVQYERPAAYLLWEPESNSYSVVDKTCYLKKIQIDKEQSAVDSSGEYVLSQTYKTLYLTSMTLALCFDISAPESPGKSTKSEYAEEVLATLNGKPLEDIHVKLAGPLEGSGEVDLKGNVLIAKYASTIQLDSAWPTQQQMLFKFRTGVGWHELGSIKLPELEFSVE